MTKAAYKWKHLVWRLQFFFEVERLESTMAEQKLGSRTAKSLHLDPQGRYIEKADREWNKSFETQSPLPVAHFHQ